MRPSGSQPAPWGEGGRAEMDKPIICHHPTTVEIATATAHERQETVAAAGSAAPPPPHAYGVHQSSDDDVHKTTTCTNMHNHTNKPYV